MKNWKAYITLLLVFCLVVVMAACAETEEPTPSEDGTSSVEESGETTLPEESTSQKPEESSTPAATTTTEPVTSSDVSDDSSSDIESDSEDPTDTSEEPVTFPNYPSDDPDPFVVAGSTDTSSVEDAGQEVDPQN